MESDHPAGRHASCLGSHVYYRYDVSSRSVHCTFGTNAPKRNFRRNRHVTASRHRFAPLITAAVTADPSNTSAVREPKRQECYLMLSAWKMTKVQYGRSLARRRSSSASIQTSNDATPRLASGPGCPLTLNLGHPPQSIIANHNIYWAARPVVTMKRN